MEAKKKMRVHVPETTTLQSSDQNLDVVVLLESPNNLSSVIQTRVTKQIKKSPILRGTNATNDTC